MKKFLICPGASKSGTTYWSHLMGQHTKIAAATVKETRFFTYEYEKGLRHYERYFKSSYELKYALDCSPVYLIDKTVPQKIRHLLADQAILVFLFRHPVDRMLSQYAMDVRYGYEQASLEQALARSESERIRLSMRNFKHPYGHDYSGESRYDEALARFLQYYDRDAMHIILFEHLIADPVFQIKKLLAFLGLTDETDSMDFEVPKGQAVAYTKRQTWVAWYMRHVSRNRIIKAILDVPLIKSIAQSVVGLQPKQESQSPTHAEHERYGPLFEDMIDALAHQTGLDLSIWQTHGSNEGIVTNTSTHNNMK